MADVKTWTGSCHCGAVRYSADFALEGGMTCNCSICHRVGAVRTFVPASAFRLEAGEGATTVYQFGSKHIEHHFCSTCGVHAFGRGAGPNGPMAAINLRCVEGVDLDTLPIQHYDGASL